MFCYVKNVIALNMCEGLDFLHHYTWRWSCTIRRHNADLKKWRLFFQYFFSHESFPLHFDRSGITCQIGSLNPQKYLQNSQVNGHLLIEGWLLRKYHSIVFESVLFDWHLYRCWWNLYLLAGVCNKFYWMIFPGLCVGWPHMTDIWSWVEQRNFYLTHLKCGGIAFNTRGSFCSRYHLKSNRVSNFNKTPICGLHVDDKNKALR